MRNREFEEYLDREYGESNYVGQEHQGYILYHLDRATYDEMLHDWERECEEEKINEQAMEMEYLSSVRCY